MKISEGLFSSYEYISSKVLSITFYFFHRKLFTSDKIQGSKSKLLALTQYLRLRLKSIAGRGGEGPLSRDFDGSEEVSTSDVVTLFRFVGKKTFAY